MKNKINDTHFNMNTNWNNGGANYNNGGFNQGQNQGGYNQGDFNQGGFNNANFTPAAQPDVRYDNMYNTKPQQNQGAYQQQQPDMGYTVQRPVGVSQGGECCCTLI